MISLAHRRLSFVSGTKVKCRWGVLPRLFNAALYEMVIAFLWLNDMRNIDNEIAECYNQFYSSTIWRGLIYNFKKGSVIIYGETG